MTEPQPARRYRFGIFEADAVTGELRRRGLRIKLNAQPFQMLVMLIDRPGQLLTREEISSALWPEGTFVDYEHGVNSAVNRIREALGDTAGNPRFIETLARRGYRFIAPVERIEPGIAPGKDEASGLPSSLAAEQAAAAEHQPGITSGILATAEELPKASPRTVRTIFVLFQLMYVGFYVGALANLAEIEDLFSPLPRPTLALNALIVTAAILIPVRASVLTGIFFHAPGLREKLLKIWPFLLAFDELWALSPFLLLHHIDFGLALACTTLLVYSPFAQRSLVLMGAGGVEREASAAAR
ncbi:MAG: winged helix-turn-helix domain-containing protein [Terracidiphilus sp.]|nr:winged helix-turn-helix domain-containing protein [Terracidiphilus sp.]